MTQRERGLGSYDWVDQKNGVVRIPIDRAMDLVAQRGLPVVSQSATPLARRSRRKKRKPEVKDAEPQSLTAKANETVSQLRFYRNNSVTLSVKVLAYALASAASGRA